MNKFEFEKTVSGRLLASFRNELLECIVVPNSLLPEDFQNQVSGCRTLAQLEKICDKRDGEYTAHQKLKATKARNIEKLARQVEAMSRHNERGDFVDIEHALDYNECEIDESKLYQNEFALVSGMINSGMIDADDLSEE